MSTIVEVDLAKGGCEAVVESFFYMMKSQQTAPNISNELLTDRTIVDSLYPVPYRCPNTLKSVANIST